MFLSEMLPPERVQRCVLVDKAWPRHDRDPTRPLDPHHISPEHLYGEWRVEGDGGDGERAPPARSPSSVVRYAERWPIPLHMSKQDLKNATARREMRRVIFERADGPVLLLAVHLCGILSLRAVDLFNENAATVHALVLKPCCLPPMMHARREEIFAVGAHRFAAADVCAHGKFNGGRWKGPQRWHLERRFRLWTEHLFAGVEPGDGADDSAEGGRKAVESIRVQVDGGYQNLFVFAERAARDTALWDGLEARRVCLPAAPCSA